MPKKKAAKMGHHKVEEKKGPEGKVAIEHFTTRLDDKIVMVRMNKGKVEAATYSDLMDLDKEGIDNWLIEKSEGHQITNWISLHGVDKVRLFYPVYTKFLVYDPRKDMK